MVQHLLSCQSDENRPAATFLCLSVHKPQGALKIGCQTGNAREFANYERLSTLVWSLIDSGKCRMAHVALIAAGKALRV